MHTIWKFIIFNLVTYEYTSCFFLLIEMKCISINTKDINIVIVFNFSYIYFEIR